MAHVTDLSTDIQNAMLQTTPAICRVEIILDPGGDAIDLSSRLLRSAPLTLSKRKSITPYSNLGKFEISETTITFKNSDDYFNHNTKGSEFYYVASRLYSAKASGDTYVRVLKGDGALFDAAMKVFIEGTQFTIDTIDTTNSKYDQVNFTSSGSIAFDAGKVMETKYWPGAKVEISTTIDGVSDKVEQFTGRLKALPKLSPGRATITLYDNFKPLLDIDCKANSILILTNADGQTKSTIEYNRAEDPESSGTLSVGSITVWDHRCPIGEWKIVFTNDSGNFKITHPNGAEYTGVTGQSNSFPASGDADISIGATGFSGSFDTDDEITFQTVLSLGKPVTTEKDIPSFIYAVLDEDFGADLGPIDFDTQSYLDLIDEYDEMAGAITYTKPVKVLKVIEDLQQHINAANIYRNDGLISINVYRPRYEEPTIKELSPLTEIMALEQEDAGRIDHVRAEYDYDYDKRKFLSTVDIPESIPDNASPITVKFPAYHAGGDAQARAAAERIWVMNRKGVKRYTITEKWNYGLSFEIGDLFKVSSTHPKFANRVVEIYEIVKDVVNCTVRAKAYDLNHAFGHFLFIDVDKLDSGKVLW